MILKYENGVLYADNLIFSFGESGNGIDLRHGSYAVTIQYAHSIKREMPHAHEFGWLGAHPECVLVLGTIRGRIGVVPCPDTEGRLVAIIDKETGRGKPVTLEVV